MLTHARLTQILRYDPTTGVFTWRVKPCDRIMAGAVASNVSKRDGYVRIGIDGRRYAAHRLAWFYVKGEWPADQIDHRNGIRRDNSWVNLRLATAGINNQNTHWPRARNKVGLLGVSKNATGKPFSAYIKYNGKNKNLGRFLTADEAHAAYVKAKRQHHPGGTL